MITTFSYHCVLECRGRISFVWNLYEFPTHLLRNWFMLAVMNLCRVLSVRY